MKQQQFFIALGLSALSLVLGLWVMFISSSNRSLQRSYNETLELEKQKKTPEVQKGAQSQQIGVNIIKDMGGVALQNTKMKDVLKKHGIDVRANPTPTP